MLSTSQAQRVRAGDQANEALPAAEQKLRVERTERQAQIAAALNRKNQSDSDLLVRLQALDAATAANSTLNAARWLLFLLFTTIGCLPILVKVLLDLGPETTYEKVLELEEQARLQVVKQNIELRQRADLITAETILDEARRMHEQRLEVAEAALAAWRERELEKVSADPEAYVAKQTRRIVPGTVTGTPWPTPPASGRARVAERPQVTHCCASFAGHYDCPGCHSGWPTRVRQQPSAPENYDSQESAVRMTPENAGETAAQGAELTPENAALLAEYELHLHSGCGSKRSGRSTS